MSLWIRSQDRECLLKTDIVMLEEIEENKEYWIYAGHELYDPYRVFGVYHKKERALEVLDEIQQILKSETIETETKYIDNQVYETKITRKPFIPKNIVIYEMPEK